jgi:uncharacterized protein YcbX
MRLAAITRYPVKSLQGEPVSVGHIDADGLRGDRCWGIRDEATGKVLTARRAPRLLFAAASLAPDGTPVITLPTGATCHGPGPATDAALSAWLGRPVRLVSSVDAPAGRAEYFADATDDTSEAIEWTMPSGRFVDALPLLVLTTASLRTAAALHPSGDWHPRRFRANLLVEVDGDGWAEDGWCGPSYLRVGDALLQPEAGCTRCTMVTRPQPGLDDDREIFRTLARHHGARFGVWSRVVDGATVHVGDDVGVEARQLEVVIAAQRDSEEDETRRLDPA